MNFQEMTIEEIKIWLTQVEKPTLFSLLKQLEQDQRKGVQQLLRQWHLREQKVNILKERWEKMNQEERQLREQGMTMIAGIDEVGRGPLAGPVVMAAVILPADFKLLGLDDSKRLTPVEREEFAEIIKGEALAYAIASLDSVQIDSLNIYQATLKGMIQAVKQLSIQPQFLLIDALKLDLPIPQKAMIKGDAHSVSIAAASILAKVHRDNYMTEMASLYPQYGFERNMGYATQEHIKALETYGPTPLHRQSFLGNYYQRISAR